MTLKNPLDIAGPNPQPNVQQPDYRIPTVNANVQNYPVGNNPLQEAKPPVSTGK
jgi:hypothetical protein